MPGIGKRELQRMRSRLEFIFRRLDGKRAEAGPGGSDEFAVAQNHLKELIVTARAKIQEKGKVEKRGGNVLELRKAKNEVAEAMADVDDTLGNLKTVLQATLESNKFTSKLKEERTLLVEKFEDLVRNLHVAASGERSEEPPAARKRVDRLEDLKGKYRDVKNQDETRNDIFGEDHPDDDRVLGEWRAEDQRLDAKLNDVVLLLDEIQVINQNLGKELEMRDAVMAQANKDAAVTNHELQLQNKSLAYVLKKYRSPGKFCLDFCLVVLLLGLIAVIVMLAINGKS